MDSGSVRRTLAPTAVKIAGIEFDRVVTTAVDFDATPEGHHTRYGPDGSLVGLTIVNARWWLEKDGEIAITLAEQKVRATDIGAVLAAA